MKINKIKDTMHNATLATLNWVRYNILRKKHGNFVLPYGYTLSHSEYFTDMSFYDLDALYIRRQYWGDYHPADLHQWYDPAAVTLNDGLNLCITENTKDVTSYKVNNILMDNLQLIKINNGVGLVTSVKSYTYGIFEWNIILPKGVGLWPAVWMSSRDSWPPEIDVIEGYSDKNGKYGKNINTNIHCGSSDTTHYGIGANRHGLFVNTDLTLNLICDWNADRIKIYYNGFLCRVLTNGDDTKWFKNENMRIILNHGLRKDVIKNIAFEKLNISPLVIKDFRYYTNKKGA